MTDIVERLREPIPWCEDYNVERREAADEIERLTRERDEQRAENAKLCDGIHRLERERDEARTLLQATANDNARLAAILSKIDRAQFDRWCSTRRPAPEKAHD